MFAIQCRKSAQNAHNVRELELFVEILVSVDQFLYEWEIELVILFNKAWLEGENKLQIMLFIAMLNVILDTFQIEIALLLNILGWE